MWQRCWGLNQRGNRSLKIGAQDPSGKVVMHSPALWQDDWGVTFPLLKNFPIEFSSEWLCSPLRCVQIHKSLWCVRIHWMLITRVQWKNLIINSCKTERFSCSEYLLPFKPIFQPGALSAIRVTPNPYSPLCWGTLHNTPFSSPFLLWPDDPTRIESGHRPTILENTPFQSNPRTMPGCSATSSPRGHGGHHTMSIWQFIILAIYSFAPTLLGCLVTSVLLHISNHAGLC